MGFRDIFLELVVGYLALFITVKCLGKTQISQITPFYFISSLVLGDLVGGAMFDEQAGIVKILFSVGIWGILIYVTEMATQKSRGMRYLLEGTPSILVKKGNLDWKEMKKNRIDIDQLRQMLRTNGVFSLQEVEYAILENNGSLSVLKKSEADQPTYQDLNMKVEQKDIPLTIISDGEVLLSNLQKAGMNEDWLQKQLKAKGVRPRKKFVMQSGNLDNPSIFKNISLDLEFPSST